MRAWESLTYRCVGDVKWDTQILNKNRNEWWSTAKNYPVKTGPDLATIGLLS